MRNEFHIGIRALGGGDIVRLSYPAVSTTRGKCGRPADRESDTRTEITVQSWKFVDAQSIRLSPPASYSRSSRLRAVAQSDRVQDARRRLRPDQPSGRFPNLWSGRNASK
jgi:hypothetical protein